MKKSTLFTGALYLLIGILCAFLAIKFEWKIESLLWGLAGAGIVPGSVMIWKYLYWMKPQNREEYEKRMKTERIEMQDERKIMLRDKSGRITYMIMIGVYCVLMMFFALCVVLDLFMPFSRYIVIVLGLLLLLQWGCGLFVFDRLEKKY